MVSALKELQISRRKKKTMHFVVTIEKSILFISNPQYFFIGNLMSLSLLSHSSLFSN